MRSSLGRLALAVALVAGMSMLPTIEARASSVSEEWPTLQYNHRGEDVRALQYVLSYRGYGVVIDGVFGSGTRTKVEAFQTATSLTSDGIVGSGTWTELLPTVALGDSNYAVRAVQSLLNAKRGSGHYEWSSVTVDGIFGSGTRQAVKDFQDDVGITSDGVVGPSTWEHLLWHFDLMTTDSYICAPSQPASESWGTASSVGALKRAGHYFRTQGGSATDLPFWDLSYVHGGYMSPHSTHRVGMDADIGIILNDDSHCGSGRGVVWCKNTYTDGNGKLWCHEDGQYHSKYHQSRTRALVWDLKAGASFSGTQMVKLFYYNDPVVRAVFGTSFMKKASSHDHHLHIRWCTASHSNGSYEC